MRLLLIFVILVVAGCTTTPTEHSADAASTTVCIISWCAINEVQEGEGNEQTDELESDLELVPQ